MNHLIAVIVILGIVAVLYGLRLFIRRLPEVENANNSPDIQNEKVNIVPRTDLESQKIIDEYREKYQIAPLGLWVTSLDYKMGMGFDGLGLFGSSIEFRSDGTGTFQSWSTMGGNEEIPFRWNSAGPCLFAVVTNDDCDDEPELIAYDFFMLAGSNQVYMHQKYITGHLEQFWLSVGPLIAA